MHLDSIRATVRIRSRISYVRRRPEGSKLMIDSTSGRRTATRRAFFPLASLASLQPALAAGVTGADLEEVVVTANRVVLAGEPRAASEGTVLGEQLENRPLLRVGELLEVVPGLIVTQHTGDGKANQYFLRGFNLDHGTDFSTRVEGMPVNLPTHGHGQGYMDVSFVIPELVERIAYRKGTYYAELGNFSAAGAAEIDYVDGMVPFVSVAGGEDRYTRAVAAGSAGIAGGDLLGALEYDSSDGPWKLRQDMRKRNGVLRFARSGADAGSSVALMGYDGEWRATDQIPLRAIADGRLDRFGFVDPTNGGRSHRYSLSAEGFRRMPQGELTYSAYAVDYRLQLFSNFTYALDEDDGDQFEQLDDRRVYGAGIGWSQPLAIGALGSEWRAGLDVRHDDIGEVGLFLTTARARRATVRQDSVRQTLSGAWTALATRWSTWLRTELGVRADRFDFDVASDLAANSGSGHDDLVSPKLSLALGPWRDTKLFIAAGNGFHSNDARGATIAVDPSDGVTAVERVTPLVKAEGGEIGVRTALVPRAQIALSLWQLDIDSELLFVGDGGTTEASRPSRRRGIELALYARPFEGLIVDADLAWSRPRFRDRDPAGERIPGAVERVASLGATVDLASGWFGGARLRYLGPASLIEDGSVRSPSSTLLNVEIGRRFGERWKLTAGVYNALDRAANDITYFYESRLPGENAAVQDLHFHPVEPRTLRVTLEARR